ncbi:hypothetical protein ACFXJ8_35940 [Nonomuraea sp. NPDC059194]|uniref:hypothetical protein n=1 Tax=Nonomuraea sp. NPDC059194 TaxID=3346764 RepID=UPI003691DD32
MALDLDEWMTRLFVLGIDDDFLDDPADSVAVITEFLARPERALENYTPDEVNSGLWHLAGNSELFFELYHPAVPLPARLACAAGIRELYRRLFEPHCASVLGHDDSPGHTPLNSICYMWWDTLSTWGRPNDPTAHPIDQALLAVMRDTLTSPNEACVEGALHGLGHWHDSYPAQAEKIVVDYLATKPVISEPLYYYAHAAKLGRVM